MNDRFRFRVFLKYNQIMYNIDSYCFLQGLNKCVFHFTSGGQKTLKSDDFILMQCTGLKDKNSKLIYEGDIVKETLTDFINEEIITVVKWDKLNTGYNLENLQNCEREVIGNIYENKELLEE